MRVVHRESCYVRLVLLAAQTHEVLAFNAWGHQCWKKSSNGQKALSSLVWQKMAQQSDSPSSGRGAVCTTYPGGARRSREPAGAAAGS